jgi:hypothetical protein
MTNRLFFLCWEWELEVYEPTLERAIDNGFLQGFQFGDFMLVNPMMLPRQCWSAMIAEFGARGHRSPV